MSLTYFKRYRMEARPAAVAICLRPLPPGYRFVPWRAEDDRAAGDRAAGDREGAPGEGLLDRHAEAKHESFRNELDAIVFDCLGRRDGCRDLLKKIAAKPTFLPQATWLIEYVAEPPDHARRPGRPPKTEPCGTIQGTLVTPRLGAIHNVGVAPLHRGRGLGRALVAMAMDGFAQAGAAKVYLEATAENDAAIQMYRKLGFRRTRTSYKAVDLADRRHAGGLQRRAVDAAFAGRP